MNETAIKAKIAVWKFASCDGCQLQLLDLEDELLALADAVNIAYFMEASRHFEPGPYDISIVEGSITTAHDLERILDVRAQSKFLMTIGACATSGGIQALRNFADVDEFVRIVYAEPSFIKTLEKSTAISEHVHVDFELRGCPINKRQLLEVLTALVHGKPPKVPTYSVCIECKARGNSCVMVTRGAPCLGPVTQAGCHAICPAYDRACFGCYGPTETPNLPSLLEEWRRIGATEPEIERSVHTFNAWAPAFREIPADKEKT